MQVQFLSDDGEVVGTQEIERTPEQRASEALERARGDLSLVPDDLRDVACRVKATNARAMAKCDAVIAGRAPAEITVVEDGRSRVYRFYLTGRKARPAKVRRLRGRRRERRPAARRRAGASSRTASADPGDSDPEPPPADWHWSQPDSWAGLIASVRSGDVERELHVERWTGVRA